MSYQRHRFRFPYVIGSGVSGGQAGAETESKNRGGGGESWGPVMGEHRGITSDIDPVLFASLAEGLPALARSGEAHDEWN
ncbi:MAG TPA: hypothetical protein VFV83_05600 [Chthoniobacteraceae bacterium]|nr:hypothetical protein [Chthoniobacteraceae bacterium]